MSDEWVKCRWSKSGSLKCYRKILMLKQAARTHASHRTHPSIHPYIIKLHKWENHRGWLNGQNMFNQKCSASVFHTWVLGLSYTNKNALTHTKLSVINNTQAQRHIHSLIHKQRYRNTCAREHTHARTYT